MTTVEVSVDGENTEIRACVNEDDWRAEVDGELVPRPDVKGNVLTGATADREGGTWILTGLNPGEDKNCA